MKRWSSYDNSFHLDEFYDNIVSMFEDNADSQWVVDTLKWWNEYDFIWIFYIESFCYSYFSQVPGIRSKSGKKTTVCPRIQQIGPTPAQRIAAQLSNQSRDLLSPSTFVSGRQIQKALHRNDYDDENWSDPRHKYTSNLEDADEDLNPYASSTEPESDEGPKPHEEWEKRKQKRERRRRAVEEERRKERMEGVASWEEEEYEEEWTRQGEEARQKESETRRMEEACKEEARRKAEEHRKEEQQRMEEQHRKELQQMEEERRAEEEKRRQQIQHEVKHREEEERRKEQQQQIQREEERKGEEEIQKKKKHQRAGERQKEGKRKLEEHEKEKRRRPEDETQGRLQLPSGFRVIIRPPATRSATNQKRVYSILMNHLSCWPF